jgi:hypothetical protein
MRRKMFGNGSDASGNPAGTGLPPAPETSSLWGDMFGMGSLFKLISDPGLMAHTHAMMAAVIEGANANRRIEAKLDRLLKGIGHEISDINARFPAQLQPPPALLTQHGAHAAGGNAAATGAVDDGSGGDAAEPSAARVHVSDDRGGSGAA